MSLLLVVVRLFGGDHLAAFGIGALIRLLARTAAFFDHITAAVGAFDRRGHIPGIEVALGIILAAVEHTSALGAAHDHAPAALGARHAVDRLQNGLRVAAGGEIRAGVEAAVATVLDDHVRPALFADDVGDLVFDDDLLDLRVRLFERLLKRAVEIREDAAPVALAGLDAVELLFHVGGKRDVDDDVREILFHKTRDDLPELRGGPKRRPSRRT